jgi:hypothetical protein
MKKYTEVIQLISIQRDILYVISGMRHIYRDEEDGYMIFISNM